MQTRKLFFRPGNAPRLRTAMLLTVLGVLAGSCAKEQPEPGIGGIELQVVGVSLEENTEQDARESAAGNIPQTRATETNGIFTFEDGDALSLFMRGDSYAAVDNRRVAYSKPDHAAGTWTIEGSPILLNDRTAVVSLVYPYKAGATFDNIPFTTGPYSPDKDLLFKQQPVYAAVHEARVEQMQHALTRVKFIIKRDDPSDTSIPDRFNGTGQVSKVRLDFRGPGANDLFTEGKLNLSFSAPELPVTGTLTGDVVDGTDFMLSTTGHTTDLLLVPGVLAKKLILSLEVDGVSIGTGMPITFGRWEAGTCYTYNVTVKNRGIQIFSSTVDNWDDTGTSGSSDVEKPEPASVGDYYYSDGTTSQRLKAGKTAKGIVFWVDPSDSKHYKVAALKEEGKQWSTSWFDVGTGTYAGIRDRTGNYSAPAWQSGKTNREILERWIADDAVNTTNKTIADFPAFQYCDQMGEGWYLPAVNELQYLWCAYNAIAPQNWGLLGSQHPPGDGSAQAAFNARLTAVDGGVAISADHYWSATEFSNDTAYKVRFENGSMGMSDKTPDLDLLKVRCIREVN